MKHTVHYYSNARGDEIVSNFIGSLDISTRAKALRIIDLLEEFGQNLKMPYSKKVAKNIYELRVRGRNHIRLFYGFIDNATIILLHGIKKKTNKLPKKDLTLACKRLKEAIDN